MQPLAELPKAARWEFGRPDPQLLPRITLGTTWYYSRSGIGPDRALFSLLPGPGATSNTRLIVMQLWWVARP